MPRTCPPAVVHRGSENGNRYSPSGREVLTRGGVMIDVTAPRPDQIALEDIAVSLAHQERFTGHCPLRPTVAQHSLAVEWIGGQLFRDVFTDPLEDRLLLEQQCRQECLMHDAPEFLVSDLNGAVKKELRQREARRVMNVLPLRHPKVDSHTSAFDQLETLAERAIAERFRLTSEWGAIVHEADILACAYEMAWDGWCADAHPPRWVAESVAVRRAYVDDTALDGGEAAFLRRAAFLGMK